MSTPITKMLKIFSCFLFFLLIHDVSISQEICQDSMISTEYQKDGEQYFDGFVNENLREGGNHQGCFWCGVWRWIFYSPLNSSGSHISLCQRALIRCALNLISLLSAELTWRRQTASSILTFILAMTLYPEVQRKAQAELESVVGMNKLPTFEHKNDLPYIWCILLETLRWQPTTPTGVPHLTTEEIRYDGFRIPSGTFLPFSRNLAAYSLMKELSFWRTSGKHRRLA